jgi:hypothetical protein
MVAKWSFNWQDEEDVFCIPMLNHNRHPTGRKISAGDRPTYKKFPILRQMQSPWWTALHRLTHRGMIRRLAQGLYDFPKTDLELGTLSPDPEAVAQAVARGRSIRVQSAGAYAANLLGLSEQVPARIVFLTDGAPRRIRFENQAIVLRRTTPRNMETAGRISGEGGAHA